MITEDLQKKLIRLQRMSVLIEMAVAFEKHDKLKLFLTEARLLVDAIERDTVYGQSGFIQQQDGRVGDTEGVVRSDEQNVEVHPRRSSKPRKRKSQKVLHEGGERPATELAG